MRSIQKPAAPAHPNGPRRALTTVSVFAGVVLGLLATTGVATVAAPEAATPTTMVLAGARTVTAPVVDAITTTTDDAQSTLDDAQDALGAASTIATEVGASGLDIGLSDTSVDTTALREATDTLSDADMVPVLLFPQLAEDTATETRLVTARVAELRTHLEAAQAQKAAEEAAAEAQRQAEAEAAAEAQRQADALAAANTPEGAKAVAAQLAADEYGWGSDQFSCLTSLWQRESNWNYQAYNAGSGATGIPQALPGSKMASAGSDWATNAATQITWGLDYISRAYGTPCSAWGHSQSSGWY